MDLKVGYIGLGMRSSCLNDILLPNLSKNDKVVAVCDVYEDRCEKKASEVEALTGYRPKIYTDYHMLLADGEVNCVFIVAAWEVHVEIAIAAMKAGKAVALEVGGAYDIKDCYDLVSTYEETHTPFMFLENCCYDRTEMAVLNMVKQGLFGKIVHCSGGYMHDIRDEVAFGNENRHYRLRNYLTRNCDNYPTHELGPIARILNINHGNRMLSLTSTASLAAGLHEYILEKKSDDKALVDARIPQGDIVTTVIKCAGGETITLTLDTTLPRYYSRAFTVRGTKGMYDGSVSSVFLDDPSNDFFFNPEEFNNIRKYYEKYDDPLWKEFTKETNGNVDMQYHGGIDDLVYRAFINAFRNGLPMPIDVYDAASWMSITPLSEMSISKGSAPVAIPDFTRGKWDMR